MPVKNRFAELLPEITAWRRDFHAHPELLFDVHRTAARVAELCRAFGCDEVVEGVGRTGVVAVIRGRSDRSGRAIGLRADMDALPIVEQTGRDYASKSPGRMHACGHDGHTAMLLGAAKYLAETRNFDGRVVLLFQPAEEGGGGGREMVEAGALERWNVSEVYGMHNQPGLPVGHFAIRPGPLMAAADQFEIRVTGKGGHAAKPHETVDPMVISAQIILGLQTIASRIVDPLKQVVVSVCTITSDSPAHNVIPQVVVMKGTVRSFDKAVRALAEEKVKAIVSGIAGTFGASGEVIWHPGYPATVNAAENTGFALEVARGIAGEAAVIDDIAPQMGAEDFSYMLEARPGAYIFVGNGETASVHHPAYDFDDDAIPFGASWFAGMVEARLPAG
ncbi:M20 aminoacylase family protein [Pseudogemmobacter sonorensis]|uniref:M20 aminoacylase family protein n=1 Tax=Pseudogemmobacter sonorensis TaxID=2989681 RepID=UPI00368DE784